MLGSGWDLIGGVIVVASGVYTFYREEKLSAVMPERVHSHVDESSGETPH